MFYNFQYLVLFYNIKYNCAFNKRLISAATTFRFSCFDQYAAKNVYQLNVKKIKINTRNFVDKKYTRVKVKVLALVGCGLLKQSKLEVKCFIIMLAALHVMPRRSK